MHDLRSNQQTETASGHEERRLSPDKRYLYLELFLLFSFLVIIWFHRDARLSDFGDTWDYADAKNLLLQRNFAGTITAMRGQTFPALWALSERFDIHFPLVAAIFNVMGALFLIFSVRSFSKQWGHGVAISVLLILSSVHVFNYHFSHLSESAISGCLFACLGANLLFLKKWRDFEAGLVPFLGLLLAGTVFLIATLVLNSLKQYFLLWIYGFLGMLILTSLFALLRKRSKQHVYRLLSPLVLFLAVCFIPQRIYIGPPKTAQDMNYSFFLLSNELETYLGNRLNKVPDGPLRTRFLDIQNYLHKSKAKCAEEKKSELRCLEFFDPAFGSKKMFFDLFFSDLSGILSLNKLAFNAWLGTIAWGNFRGPAYSKYFNFGHELFATFGPLIAFLLILNVFLTVFNLFKSFKLATKQRAAEAWFRLVYLSSEGIAIYSFNIFMAIGSALAFDPRVLLGSYILFVIHTVLLLIDTFGPSVPSSSPPISHHPEWSGAQAAIPHLNS